MKLSVILSPAGRFYIGYTCLNCGPYSRVSEEYYTNVATARAALDTETYTVREHP
jgi:hypothetical protein